MRLLPVVICLPILGIAAILCSTHQAQAIGTPSFTSIACQETIPCQDGADSLTTEELAQKANNCLSNTMAMRAEGGYFDENKYLDNDQCLTTLSKFSNGKTLMPHCCVIAADNACRIHCTLVEPQSIK